MAAAGRALTRDGTTLERLEAVLAIRTLKHTYMSYCDRGYPPDKLGPLFTEDAVWTNAQFGHAEGRAAIERFFGGTSATVAFAAHLALNDLIEVDGEHASGHWRMLMPCTMIQDGAATARLILGEYDETYVRERGVWKFSRIDFFVNFDVEATAGWAGLTAVRPLPLAEGRPA
jgi:ketosteroid isomerase-like protein